MRVGFLVFTVSLTLVLLPIAINVGTGGTAPDFLAEYVRWTWPAVGILWLAAILTGVIEYRSRRIVTRTARSADQPRNRPNALAHIERYYRQRFAGSLASRTRLALALDESSAAVVRPYDLLVRPLHSTVAEVHEDADIAAAFDELQDSMVILGAPGSGKSTLLLDLARSLADEADRDHEQPLPVLVDLAGWTGATPARPEDDDDPADSPLLANFVAWLLDELDARYQIPAPVGRVWLSRGRLALLLDGVDEITPSYRDKLAQVLDELRRRYLIGQLAITCRIQDYEQLPEPLSLYGAVRIRPLSRRQVLDYFTAAGDDLAGARAAVEQDDDLWDLVDSPLMLNVMALAYQGRDAREIAAGAVADHRRELFDTYVAEVLSRQRAVGTQYDARTAVRSLWCLAWWTRSRAGDRIAVPRWLTPNGWYGLVLPAVGSLAHKVCLPALFAGLVGGSALAASALYGVPAGLAVGVMSLLLVHIRPRPWRTFRERSERPPFLLAAVMVMAGVVAGCAAVLGTIWLLTVLPTWLGLVVEAAAIGASYGVELIVSHGDRRRWWLLLRLAVVTAGSWVVLAVTDRPGAYVSGVAIGLIVAQGIRLVKALPMDHLVYSRDREDGRDLMDLWVVAGLGAAIVVAVGLGAELGAPEPEGVLGVIAGVVAAKAWRRRPPLFAGPTSRLLHGLLLRWTGYLPWRRRAFLRYAADRFVLSRTGRGEYAFIHLLVRDHLAECDPDALAAKVDHRITTRRDSRPPRTVRAR
ncbi:NACHT domain-containing protein [Kribbella amoyensis]|uniref:NACHT domain-containing protein n=1 Tax=Kribbella amoyensis TaxID=996641 RepID=UPI001EE180D3|nr:NACHT domain-containing protein [Kribbella amoyensis]